MIHSARNLNRTKGTKSGGGNTYLTFNPKAPKVGNCSRCNSTDIDWYVRIPTDPSLVPRMNCILSYEEEGATQESTDPERDSQLPHLDGYIYWNMSNVILDLCERIHD